MSDNENGKGDGRAREKRKKNLKKDLGSDGACSKRKNEELYKNR